MGVSAAAATAMVKKLAELGLVEHRPYHGAQLTDAGDAGGRSRCCAITGCWSCT